TGRASRARGRAAHLGNNLGAADNQLLPGLPGVGGSGRAPSMARAILWDMDGVLVNSMEFHYQAYGEVLAEFGRDLSREEYLTSLIGLRNYVIFGRLLGDLPQQEVERLMAAKEKPFP